MTEERRLELRQLLNEAMESLEIRERSGAGTSSPPMDVHSYRAYLQQRRPLSWVDFNPDITNEDTRSKLLDFIRVEFAPFIHEDSIQSASFFISGGGFDMGYPLDTLLKQLLKIAIVREIEGAIPAVNRCTIDPYGPFQYMALLEGIRLETEVQVLEGMRLVPLSHSRPELVPDVYIINISGLSEKFFFGKTLLIIDAFVSPIFCKPFPELFREGFREDDLPFRVGVSGGNFPNFEVEDFYEKFCQALSLACNSAVKIPLKWQLCAEDELFNLSGFGLGGFTRRYDADSLGSSPEAGEAQMDKAKCLYEKLVNPDPNVSAKLQIPIDRWIKSKTTKSDVDKMIDLGIAFEALYVPDSGRGEIRFKLAVRAAWYLGKDKDDRNKLLTKFKQIYDHRSNAVHRGKLDEKVKLGGEHISISEFIERAQNLCRESIMKVLNDGRFPVWNDLILGGEMESDIIALGENPGGLG